MKFIIAVLSGIIGGLAIVFLGYMVFNSLYPYPEGIDLDSKEQKQAFINTFTQNAYMTKVITNLVAVFTVGFLSSLIEKHMRYQAGVVAVLPFLIYILAKDFTFIYPTYYVLINISLSLIVGFLGIIFGGSRNIS